MTSSSELFLHFAQYLKLTPSSTCRFVLSAGPHQKYEKITRTYYATRDYSDKWIVEFSDDRDSRAMMRCRGEIGGRRLHCDYITAREADEQYAIPEPDERRGSPRGSGGDHSSEAGPQCTRPGRAAERSRSRDNSDGPPPAQRRRRASSSVDGERGNGGRGAGHPPDPAGQIEEQRRGSVEADDTETGNGNGTDGKRHSPNAVPLASIFFDGTPVKLSSPEMAGNGGEHEQRRHSASPERMNGDGGENRRWSEGAQVSQPAAKAVETAVEEEGQPQSCIIKVTGTEEDHRESEEQLKQLPTYDFEGIRRWVL